MWNYISPTESSNGYEDCTELQKYTHEYYENLTDEEREQTIEKVFNIYRGKNIFPIVYYNKKGCFNEIQRGVGHDGSKKEGIYIFKKD